MFAQIGQLIIEFVANFFVFALLLRFYMQLFRAPFRNPVGQFIAAVSNWMVLPARRVIPGLFGTDLATLVLAWVIQVLSMLLIGALLGAVNITGAMTLVLPMAAIELLRHSLRMLIVVVIVQMVVSWMNSYTPLSPVFDALTRPFYNLFRRFIPPIGSVDLSPLFVVLLAQIGLLLVGGLSAMIVRL